MLDVGSGHGRFALALAPRAASVIAVDPSQRMLSILRRRARESGLTNVRTVVGMWPDAESQVELADVVVCAHVLPLIPDAKRFLNALDRRARRRVFVYLGRDGSFRPPMRSQANAILTWLPRSGG